MKLYEELTAPGFHTTIITTFGVEFSAYEDLVLNRLRSAGCRNNILVVDSRMLSHALSGESSPPKYSGRYYSVLARNPVGCFIRKLSFKLAEKKDEFS